MRQYLDRDLSELLFRLLFSSIFLLLGAEHLFQDDLVQRLMPSWLPMKRACSLLSGLVLLAGGGGIALGIAVRQAAMLLGAFLVVVTLIVHVPGVFRTPAYVGADSAWLWDVFQRSNFIKNLCLLGVCLHLLTHDPGRHTLRNWLQRSPL